jgi:hypothetical protein
MGTGNPFPSGRSERGEPFPFQASPRLIFEDFSQINLELIAASNVHLAKRSLLGDPVGKGQLKSISNALAIVCPACTAQIIFCRSRTPHIDRCGFESYSLECHECGAGLAGIIDPYDDELLLSELEG